jgi:hypothetical protein
MSSNEEPQMVIDRYEEDASAFPAASARHHGRPQINAQTSVRYPMPREPPLAGILGRAIAQAWSGTLDRADAPPPWRGV